MKRTLSILLVLALLCALTVPVSAAVATPIQPRYTYLGITSGAFQIDEQTGAAYCIAKCTAASSVTIEITGKLQQFKNGKWTTLKTWVEIGNLLVTFDKLWYVVSGYQYRFVITYRACNNAGQSLETDTRTFVYAYA